MIVPSPVHTIGAVIPPYAYELKQYVLSRTIKRIYVPSLLYASSAISHCRAGAKPYSFSSAVLTIFLIFDLVMLCSLSPGAFRRAGAALIYEFDGCVACVVSRAGRVYAYAFEPY